MALGARIALAASVMSVVIGSLAHSAGAQQPRVGVVTNVEGMATVARVALPQPQQLHFKDDVFLKDRITTGDRAIVRVLLGGKATVTARERSILTITEAPGVSRVELTSGRIAVAVSKAKMKPGEIVEIRTPNAVTAVRGTVVIAEVWPGKTVKSTITVLRGLVDVTRLDTGTGQQVGHSVDVAVRQSITVLGSSPLSRPTNITADEANRLTAEFKMIPSTASAASTAPAVQAAMQHATEDAARAVSTGHVAVAGGNTSSNGVNAADDNSERAGVSGTGTSSDGSSSTSPTRDADINTGAGNGNSYSWGGTGNSGNNPANGGTSSNSGKGSGVTVGATAGSGGVSGSASTSQGTRVSGTVAPSTPIAPIVNTNISTTINSTKYKPR